MKLAKILVLSLFISFFSITALPVSSNAFSIDEHQALNVSTNTVEYRYIDDQLYMVVLDDDGKVIECEAVED